MAIEHKRSCSRLKLLFLDHGDEDDSRDNILKIQIYFSYRINKLSEINDLHQLDLEFGVEGNYIPVEFHHAAQENLESIYYQCKEGCRRPLRLTGFPNLTHAAFETELQFLGLQSGTSPTSFLKSRNSL